MNDINIASVNPPKPASLCDPYEPYPTSQCGLLSASHCPHAPNVQVLGQARVTKSPEMTQPHQ